MGELAVLEGGAPQRSSVNLIEVARQAEAAKNLGATLIKSGLLPDAIKRPEQAMAIMIKGAELDLPPMYALSHIVIIQGKPAMSAEVMRALVHRAGHKIRIIESSRERAIVEGIRRDDPGHAVRITFDEEDARLAGLAGKGGHKTYPAALKLARATSALCRAAFADSVAGISYVPEELGAEVNEEGEVLSVPEPRHSEARAGGRGEATQRTEEPVEEAEVVEHDRAAYDEVLSEVESLLRVVSDQAVPDRRRVWEYAHESYDKARATRKRLRRKLEEEQDRAGEEEATEAAEDMPDEESVPDFGDMKGAAREASPQRARKSQIDLIRTLAEEINGVDGVAHVEAEIGKPLAELTRIEADRLIDQLSSEETR